VAADSSGRLALTRLLVWPSSFCSLPCAGRAGKPCRYLHTNSHIWELQRVYQPPSSWIMGHDIQEDGSFYLATIIDPLFLVLPLLDKGRNKVQIT